MGNRITDKITGFQDTPTVHPSATVRLAMRTVTVLALLVDVVVHVRLAPEYQLAFPAGIGGGNLFRIEAVAALAAALFVLVRGTRLSYAVAFVVAAGGVFAVLLYRYVDVPMLGPMPAMYEPIWFPEKTFSAIAEAIAAVVAGAAVLSSSPGRVAARNR